MLRVILFSLILLCALAPSPSRAADAVHVRGSENANYSRVVFDWGKTVPYMITQTVPGVVSVRFQQAAAADNLGLKLKNVAGMEVTSKDPLELAIKVPEHATVRDFQAGNRIIIDIYDAPGTKRAKPPEPAKTVKAEPPKPKPEEKQAAAVPPVKPEPKPEKNKVLAQAPPIAKAEVKPVEATNLQQPEFETGLEIVQPVPLDVAPPIENNRPSNLITMSSIDALGLAVFERDGKIWLVADRDNLMLAPQVSGPDAQHFMPVESMDIEGGKVFRFNAMEDARIRGQGGGLLWRVVVPAGPPKVQSTKPRRVDDNPDDLRGGKVVWPFGEARRIFKINDPITGRDMFVVTVGAAKKYAGLAIRFVDFQTIDSPVGLVIVPRVDDLQVTITESGDVEVTRPGGLALTSEERMAAMEEADKKSIKPGNQANAKRIFDFRNWQMGGIESVDHNRNVIMSQIGGLKGSDRVQGLLTLAKMYLSNGMWAEAKGFLDLAQDEMPELNQNPAFIALHGAAQALGWESEPAFDQLSVEELQQYPEVGYWRAFALADLGDWQQADQVFPEELYILSQYPQIIRTKLSLVLAEVSLRAGDTAKGEQLLGFAEEFKDLLKPPQLAAMTYLKGEAARQRKKYDETKKLWKALSTGRDPLYRAKAGLALTRLMADNKEMVAEKSIDNLERLRYAWRGDELEAQIAYWLGKTYFEHKDYVKGLVIMREAASYAADTDVGKKIITEMTTVFKKLFLGEGLNKISALDAATLHEQFTDYLPEGTEGDQIAERLAERLVKADLLDRATKLLEDEVGHLPPAEAYRISVRLAGINLLDNKPAKATGFLDKAAELYPQLPAELKTPQREYEVALLRARALSEQDKFEQALGLLNGLAHTPDVNKLRADIAWHAGYWDDAAQALEEVILDQDIPLNKPLEADNTALLLQQAVALNLSGNRVSLSSLRAKYLDAMAQTDKARIFEVITRPRQSAALADRKTLLGIVSEVDLFKDFLQGYKDEPEKQASAAPATGAPAPAAPAETPAEAPAPEAPPPAEPPASQ